MQPPGRPLLMMEENGFLEALPDHWISFEEACPLSFIGIAEKGMY